MKIQGLVRVFVVVMVVAASVAAVERPPRSEVDVRTDPAAIPPPLEQVDDQQLQPQPEDVGIKVLEPTTVERNGFVSIQVNVDAAGLDILGDAANEPSIAVDPLDSRRMAIGWRQFDNVSSNFRQAGRGWSIDRGRTWTFPGSLSAGIFRSDPVLDVDGDGRFYYYSLRGTLLCDFFFSDDGGQTWTSPHPAYGGDKQWFTIDRTTGPGRGNIYASWSLASNPWGKRVFIRSTNGGQTFSEPVVLDPAPIWGTLTVAPDGALYIAGNASFNVNYFVVWRSLDAWDSGVTPTWDVFHLPLGGRQVSGVGPNPVGLLGQLWIAADNSEGPNRGDLYAVGSVDPGGSDPMDVHFVRSSDQGETWSDPVKVNAGESGVWQWFGTMSTAPNGRIDVIWIESLSAVEYDQGEVTYAFSGDGGSTWSVPVAVSPVFGSHVGWPDQHKIGDYYDMVSDDTGADLAYSATFTGGQDVYYLRLWADCDGNGLSDAYDMWLGGVRDCNDNTVPDTCEIVESPGIDGDGDGVIDTCRTAPRTSGGRVAP